MPSVTYGRKGDTVDMKELCSDRWNRQIKVSTDRSVAAADPFVQTPWTGQEAQGSTLSKSFRAGPPGRVKHRAVPRRKAHYNTHKTT